MCNAFTQKKIERLTCLSSNYTLFSHFYESLMVRYAVDRYEFLYLPKSQTKLITWVHLQKIYFFV